jgi:hypothetical protein
VKFELNMNFYPGECDDFRGANLLCDFYRRSLRAPTVFAVKLLVLGEQSIFFGKRHASSTWRLNRMWFVRNRPKIRNSGAQWTAELAQKTSESGE